MKRHRSQILWLAHQQDDIAESMLMRLARGSGAGGLAAPRPVQVFEDKRIFLRPLLTIKKGELVSALKTAKCEWREDETNAHGDFFRNRVRAAVLPAWQQASGRDALAGAALARDLLEEDDQALELWVDRLKVLQRGVLELEGLRDAPRAVFRRALHRWLLTVQPQTDLSRRGFELLLSAVSLARPTRFSLGTSNFAVIKGGKLTLRKAR
jgi:tRNA(Ile)-lysidine synthase